ncbi:hypothetical protein KY345_00025 [Candidatus Woesearchaeota archaeon]|nr:hypothetical protein [Candidatus Woesearchaeota archaeon]
MNKISKFVSGVMERIRILKSSLDTKLYYLVNVLRVLSSRAGRLAKINTEYLKAIDKGMGELEKKREDPRYQYVIAQAQKRFLEKHKDLIPEIPKSHIKAKYREMIIGRIGELKNVKLTERTREVEKLEALFELFVVVFQNNKEIHDIIQDEMLPPAELGAKYQKELKESKKMMKEVEDVKKIIGKKKVDMHELVKIIHVYKDKEDYLNKAVAGKILSYEGYDIGIVGYDKAKEDFVFSYDKETFSVKITELNKTLPLVIIHNKIKNIVPYGKKTLGGILELEESKIKGLEEWGKASKKPQKYWITKHEEQMILRLKHAIKEKEEAARERLKKEMKKKPKEAVYA